MPVKRCSSRAPLKTSVAAVQCRCRRASSSGVKGRGRRYWRGGISGPHNKPGRGGCGKSASRSNSVRNRNTCWPRVPLSSGLPVEVRSFHRYSNQPSACGSRRNWEGLWTSGKFWFKYPRNSRIVRRYCLIVEGCKVVSNNRTRASSALGKGYSVGFMAVRCAPEPPAWPRPGHIPHKHPAG